MRNPATSSAGICGLAHGPPPAARHLHAAYPDEAADGHRSGGADIRPASNDPGWTSRTATTCVVVAFLASSVKEDMGRREALSRADGAVRRSTSSRRLTLSSSEFLELRHGGESGGDGGVAVGVYLPPRNTRGDETEMGGERASREARMYWRRGRRAPEPGDPAAAMHKSRWQRRRVRHSPPSRNRFNWAE